MNPTPKDWQDWMNYQSNKDRVIEAEERAAAEAEEEE